jgi:hypothetical protein
MPYKDPEKQREADRRWREANPEKAREVNRRWRAANPEKQREATRRWHEATAEQFDLTPSRLVADGGYGSADMVGWLVDERGIEPHVARRRANFFSARLLSRAAR